MELNSVQSDVHRLFEKMYDALDRPVLNRDHLRDLTDQLSTQTAASVLPSPIDDEFSSVVLDWGFTRTEAKMFMAMKTGLGRPFSENSLYESVWPDKDRCPEKKLLDVYICKLRKKLRAKDLPYWIENVWGVGYRLLRHEPGAPRLLGNKPAPAYNWGRPRA